MIFAQLSAIKGSIKRLKMESWKIWTHLSPNRRTISGRTRRPLFVCLFHNHYRFNPVLGFLPSRRTAARAQRRAHCRSSSSLSHQGRSLCEPPPPPPADTTGASSIPTNIATAMSVNSRLLATSR